MSNRGIIGSALALVLVILSSASPTSAAEIFLAGDVGISTVSAAASGENTFAEFQHSGKDRDQSPVYGGTVGIGVTLNELVPVRLKIPHFEVPYFPGRSIHFGSEDFRLPEWETRLEVEGLTGRDVSLLTPGFTELVPYRAEVQTWTVIGRLRMDLPIRAPIHALFGRIPILEPVTLYGSAGAGVANNEITVSDSIVSGKSAKLNFAYQFSAGMAYALTERIQWSVGWRFTDFGKIDAPLSDGLQDRGVYGLTMSSHDITTSLRFNFFHFALPEVD